MFMIVGGRMMAMGITVRLAMGIHKANLGPVMVVGNNGMRQQDECGE